RQATGEPARLAVGNPQQMALTGLSPSTTYWIGIKAADRAGNWSAMSNVVEARSDNSCWLAQRKRPLSPRARPLRDFRPPRDPGPLVARPSAPAAPRILLPPRAADS